MEIFAILYRTSSELKALTDQFGHAFKASASPFHDRPSNWKNEKAHRVSPNTTRKRPSRFNLKIRKELLSTIFFPRYRVQSGGLKSLKLLNLLNADKSDDLVSGIEIVFNGTTSLEALERLQAFKATSSPTSSPR